MNEHLSIPFSGNEASSAWQQPGTHLVPSTMINWRSRVLFAFEAEEHTLHFVDIRGRHLRIKKANEAEAYVCEQLREVVTVADVLTRTQLRYPHLAEKTVYRLLNLLLERALIEKRDASSSLEIPSEAIERYDRQLRFFGLFAQAPEDRFRMQGALTQATVTILGVGGVGNWIARHLAAMGIGHLRLVDYDVVERSNLNRQALYTPLDLGKRKVETAANALREFNPDLEVQVLPLRIASAEDIESVIVGTTIVVLTADKPMVDIRRWTTQACVRQQLPYVQGSLDAYILQIGPLYHTPHTGCYVCREISMRLAEGPSYTTRIESYRRSPRENPPLLGPLCGFVGSAVALEVARYISQYQPPSTLGRYYSIDARTWTTQVEVVPHHAHCPVCGSQPDPLSSDVDHASVQVNEESFESHV